MISVSQVLSSLIQSQCGSLAPPAGQWQRQSQSQSHQGPDQQAAGLHEHGGAAAGGGPAFSSSPCPGQGPWTGHGHGGGLLAGPRSAAQADRAALAPPVQTPAQETGGAQVTVILIYRLKNTFVWCYLKQRYVAFWNKMVGCWVSSPSCQILMLSCVIVNNQPYFSSAALKATECCFNVLFSKYMYFCGFTVVCIQLYRDAQRWSSLV